MLDPKGHKARKRLSAYSIHIH